MNNETLPIDHCFPETAADELSYLESFNKHLYRPNTYLHKWWARRSGVTFRYILKQLVSDSAQRDYYSPGGLAGKIILDPMMGGGTTIHEAIRMGANVVGSDIEPIPVLQAKASLNGTDLKQKTIVFNNFFNKLSDVLSPYYETTCPICDANSGIQFVLYGLLRKCGCREVIVVDNLFLRKSSNDTAIMLCDVCGEVYASNSLHSCKNRLKQTIHTKDNDTCNLCGLPYENITKVPYSNRYYPLVIIGYCPKDGQFFKQHQEADLRHLRQAQEDLAMRSLSDYKNFSVPDGPKSKDLHRQGVYNYLELFTHRQLMYLQTAKRLLLESSRHNRLWLSLLISTSLEFNSLLCGYKGSDSRRPGAIRHVFSHHAYSFPYTALENNPVFKGKTSGTLLRLFSDRIERGGQWAIKPVERKFVENKILKINIKGEVDQGQPVDAYEQLSFGYNRFYVFQGDSRQLPLPNDAVDYIVTDPPYYDNVQYSDLSNFFKVWLRLFLPDEADWEFDCQASAVFAGKNSLHNKYAITLEQIWRECNRVLKKPSGRLIFTFHHWKPEAWSDLTTSLKRAGFVMVNRHVVFSENPISVHIRSLKALKHDVILVLAPMRVDNELKSWSKPENINNSNSRDFCYDCGTMLGWILNNAIDMDETHIYSEWKKLLLSEGTNG